MAEPVTPSVFLDWPDTDIVETTMTNSPVVAPNIETNTPPPSDPYEEITVPGPVFWTLNTNFGTARGGEGPDFDATIITANGTGFLGATSVIIKDGVSGDYPTSYIVDSDNQIRFTIPFDWMNPVNLLSDLAITAPSGTVTVPGALYGNFIRTVQTIRPATSTYDFELILYPGMLLAAGETFVAAPSFIIDELLPFSVDLTPYVTAADTSHIKATSVPVAELSDPSTSCTLRAELVSGRIVTQATYARAFTAPSTRAYGSAYYPVTNDSALDLAISYWLDDVETTGIYTGGEFRVDLPPTLSVGTHKVGLAQWQNPDFPTPGNTFVFSMVEVVFTVV